MTYKMTDEYRKVLTEMIGEKLHEIVSEQPYEVDTVIVDSLYRCSCGYEFHANVINKHIIVANRTFTTDPDMMKVFRCLVDSGKWKDFYYWADKQYSKVENNSKYVVDMIAWLKYDAERFNVLAAQCKKEGGI